MLDRLPVTRSDHLRDAAPLFARDRLDPTARVSRENEGSMLVLRSVFAAALLCSTAASIAGLPATPRSGVTAGLVGSHYRRHRRDPGDR